MFIRFNGVGGITVDHAMTFLEKYQQVEAVLREDIRKLDEVPVITNLMEKGGGDKIEIGWECFNGKFQNKIDCSTVQDERVMRFIVGHRKDDRQKVETQRRARERGGVESSMT